MKRSGFIDRNDLKGLEKVDAQVKEQIKTLPKESQEAIRQANAAFEEITNDVFDFESENRIRKAGWTPSQAEDIAKLSRKNGVGKMFQYDKKTLVLTPFKTVVEAQVYLSVVQDRLLELTSVPVETEVIQLKQTIKSFTSLTFFGLIKLAFSSLFKQGENNG